MAGRPKTRAKREAERQAHKTGKPVLTASGRRAPKFQYLADIYAEQYTTFNALRQALIANGIVEHRINPYDVIQRAIDDTTTDYLLLRRAIDKDTQGDPDKLVQHPLYDYMESMREASVRYATFATQYDIQKRQLKLGEARVALLAATLREVLTQAGVSQDIIQQIPQRLIAYIKGQEPKGHYISQPSKLDPVKAEAMAEILSHDADVEIIDVEETT